MTERIERLLQTMQRIERLLTRFELDMAGRLYGADYQATIAMLCEEFEAQMRGLTQTTSQPEPSARATTRSSSYGFSISHTKFGNDGC